MSTPQNEAEPDESSGVTTLRPVPVKPARLYDLAESDSTTYFSASELLERGKALAALENAPGSALAPRAAPEPEAGPRRPGWLAQFRQASLARKASAILLPSLCVLLLTKTALEQSKQPAPSKPTANVAAPAVPAQPKLASARPSASVATLALPRGITAARAAADSVATGDYSRAAALYRELSRREPNNHVYPEAARILSERAEAHAP